MKQYYRVELRNMKGDYDTELVLMHSEMQKLVLNIDSDRFYILSIKSIGEIVEDITKFIKKPDGLETGDK